MLHKHWNPDIGGTKILIGIVTENGEILRAKRYPMQRPNAAGGGDRRFYCNRGFYVCSHAGGTGSAVRNRRRRGGTYFV